MVLKNVLNKAAGLFVEMPEGYDQSQAFATVPTMEPAAAPSPAPRTVEEIVKAAPGPNLDQIQTPAATAKAPPIGPDGTPDFAAIYQQSGVPTVAFGSEEALTVINSLPAELPIDVKRKTVGATLSAMGKAMGVTTDTVVADASRKIAALASFTDQLTAQTNQYHALIEQKNAELKAQIAENEAKMVETADKLNKVVKACEDQGSHLDDVLEFFTLDAGSSKHA